MKGENKAPFLTLVTCIIATIAGKMWNAASGDDRAPYRAEYEAAIAQKEREKAEQAAQAAEDVPAAEAAQAAEDIPAAEAVLEANAAHAATDAPDHGVLGNEGNDLLHPVAIHSNATRPADENQDALMMHGTADALMLNDQFGGDYPALYNYGRPGAYGTLAYRGSGAANEGQIGALTGTGNNPVAMQGPDNSDAAFFADLWRNMDMGDDNGMGLTNSMDGTNGIDGTNGMGHNNGMGNNNGTSYTNGMGHNNGTSNTNGMGHNGAMGYDNGGDELFGMDDFEFLQLPDYPDDEPNGFA